MKFDCSKNKSVDNKEVILCQNMPNTVQKLI